MQFVHVLVPSQKVAELHHLAVVTFRPARHRSLAEKRSERQRVQETTPQNCRTEKEQECWNKERFARIALPERKHHH